MRIWAEDCSIIATFGWINYERNWSIGRPYIPVYFRPVIFCDLLNQEARYIKEVLAEVFISDFAKKLFWNYREETLEWTMKSIRNKYTEFNKQYNKIKIKIDILTERLELDEYKNLTQEWLEEHKAKLMEVSIAEKLHDTKKLKSDQRNLEIQIEKQQRIVEKFEYIRKTLINKFKDKKLEVEKIIKGICPTCGTEIGIDTKHKEWLSRELEKIIDEWKHAATEKNIETERLENLKEELLIIKDKLKAATMDEDPLVKNIEGYQERVIIYKERLLEVNKMLEEREKLVNELIKLNKHPILEMYKHIGPKGTLNIKLSEEINKKFKWYEMVLFEDSSRSSEWKAVFKIYLNGVEFKQMSRSEQVTANIILSNIILTKINSSLPLLIDDFETFSTKNKTNLVKLLNKSSREYIIAEVKGKKFEVKVL